MAVVAHASSDRCLVRRVSTGTASFQHAGLAAGSGQNSLAVAESGAVPVGVGWDAMGWLQHRGQPVPQQHALPACCP